MTFVYNKLKQLYDVCNKTTGVLSLKNADKIFSVGYDHAKIRL